MTDESRLRHRGRLRWWAYRADADGTFAAFRADVWRRYGRTVSRLRAVLSPVAVVRAECGGHLRLLPAPFDVGAA